MTNDVLSGVVALVEVGAKHRAPLLRAALTALGATVAPAWSPIVTHLIWSQGMFVTLSCYTCTMVVLMHVLLFLVIV